MLKLSLFSINRVVGATALVGALALTGCMPPPSSTASCCSGKKGHGEVASTESTLVSPQVSEAMTGDAQPMLVATTLSPAQKLSIKTALHDAFLNALNSVTPALTQAQKDYLVSKKADIQDCLKNNATPDARHACMTPIVDGAP